MSKKQPSSRAPKSPQIPRQTLAKEISHGTLQSRERYSGLKLTSGNFGGQVADRLVFEECLLTHIELSTTHMSHVEMLDVRCTDCNLANAVWTPAIFQRVEWLTCQMTGLILSEANFQDVLFKECNGSFAQFRFASFQRVHFVNCNLVEADFQEADLSGVNFENCNLSRADMSKAKLNGVDLRSSEIEGLRIGAQEIQGAIINPTQAVALVQALGVIVKWPSEE